MRTTLFSVIVASLAAQATAKLPQALVPYSGLVGRSQNQHHHSAGHIHTPTKASGSAHVRSRRNKGPARLAGRDADATLLLGQLHSLCGGIQSNQQDIHTTRQNMASDKSASSKGTHYSHELSNKLAAMRAASGSATPVIGQLNTLLTPFGAGDGKLYYDQSNAFEVLLKDFVDSIKYMAADIDYIIYQLPVVGPVLGPIVYDIKCVVEDILDGLENTTDGLINGEGLIGLQNLLSGFDFLGSLGLNL